MSYTRAIIYTLWCDHLEDDGELCVETFEWYMEASSLSDHKLEHTRKAAKAEAWQVPAKRHGKDDYCPKHWRRP